MGATSAFILTLQQETATPPAATARQQQRRFDRHAAANSITSGRMKRSASSRRRAPMWRHPGPTRARLEEPWYDATHQVRRVRQTGQIKWQGDAGLCERSGPGRSWSGWPKRSAAIGPSASCTWNSGASIARRAALRPRGTAGGSDERPAAVEMSRPWKSQNDFHSHLEISHRTRDSHIPTADRPRRKKRDDGSEQSVTHVSGLICYRCFRLRRDGVQGGPDRIRR